MKWFYLIIASFWLFTACNDAQEDTAANRTTGYSDTPKTKEDSLFKEVMRDHDEGMAKTRKLSQAIRQMKARADSLVKAKRNPEMEKKVLEELEYAEMAMDKWMKEFNMDTLKEQANRRIEYLEKEKQKVSRVRSNILESIRRADSLLNGN